MLENFQRVGYLSSVYEESYTERGWREPTKIVGLALQLDWVNSQYEHHQTAQ
jgi:hypothetical protein